MWAKQTARPEHSPGADGCGRRLEFNHRLVPEDSHKERGNKIWDSSLPSVPACHVQKSLPGGLASAQRQGRLHLGHVWEEPPC